MRKWMFALVAVVVMVIGAGAAVDAAALFTESFDGPAGAEITALGWSRWANNYPATVSSTVIDSGTSAVNSSTTTAHGSIYMRPISVSVQQVLQAGGTVEMTWVGRVAGDGYHSMSFYSADLSQAWQVVAFSNKFIVQTGSVYEIIGPGVPGTADIKIQIARDNTKFFYRNHGAAAWTQILTTMSAGTGNTQMGALVLQLYKSAWIDSIRVTSSYPPVALISKPETSPAEVSTLVPVEFDGSTSHAAGDDTPGAGITDYKWTYKKTGATTETPFGTGATVNHAFTEPGTYDVKLTVTADGQTGTDAKTVNVFRPVITVTRTSYAPSFFMLNKYSGNIQPPYFWGYATRFSGTLQLWMAGKLVKETSCWEGNDVLREGTYTGVLGSMMSVSDAPRKAIHIEGSNGIWIHRGSSQIVWSEGCIVAFGTVQADFERELYDKLQGLPGVPRNDIDVRIWNPSGSVPYLISGRVHTLLGATVSVTGPGFNQPVTTLANGDFALTVPTPGEYTVTASAPGYTMQRKPVNMPWSWGVVPGNPSYMPETTKVTVGWPPAVYGIEFIATPNYRVQVGYTMTRVWGATQVGLMVKNTGAHVHNVRIGRILLNNVPCQPLDFGDMNNNQSEIKPLDFPIPGAPGTQASIRCEGTYIKPDTGTTGTFYGTWRVLLPN